MVKRTTNSTKLIILGQGRHGKDTLAEIIQKYTNLTFVSSSLFAAEKIMYPQMGQYSNVQECFDDRHNHRAFWFDKISEYNKDDPGRLAKEIFCEYDIYVGLRNAKELEKAPVSALRIWVDATERKGNTEDSSSCTVTKDMADIVIYNNGTEAEFEQKVLKLCKLLNSKNSY
jgi:hypothetical protein